MPLFLVATPIGNLGDLSARARETLELVDAVIAEDTRHSGQLLHHLGIKKPMLSLPAFDEAARIGPIVARLVAGKALALVTDAGTPAVSDPGALLVRAAIEAGVAIIPIPGPSAAVTALSASGFTEGRFHFAGFLPRKGPDRAEMLRELKPLRAQLVFYEAPGRLHETLLDLATALGDRPALVARELTKLHEELARAKLSQLAVRFAEETRGEIVIVVAGAEIGRARRGPGRAAGRAGGRGAGPARGRREAQGDRRGARARARQARGLPAGAEAQERGARLRAIGKEGREVHAWQRARFLPARAQDGESATRVRERIHRGERRGRGGSERAASSRTRSQARAGPARRGDTLATLTPADKGPSSRWTSIAAPITSLVTPLTISTHPPRPSRSPR